MMQRWEVEFTNEFESWWEELTIDEQQAVGKAVEALAQHGPNLKRPLVGEVIGPKHPNIKELRVPASFLRVLFAFDPRRAAILLIGGDKAGSWKAFYARMIPVADALYDQHLAELREEGLIR